MILTIYLLRHGETKWNAEGNKYCGRTDLDLTEKGLQQAEIVREKLKDISFEAVYSSPLIRAKRTAELVSGRKDVVVEERLIETDFGSWEGKSKSVFIPENPKLWEDWMKDPYTHKAGGTGETGGSVVRRGDEFFTSLLKKHSGEKPVMAVAHNGFNRLYLSYKLGMPLGNYRKFVMDNASVNIFTLDDEGEMTLTCVNR